MIQMINTLVYLSNVKSISIQLLHIIAHKAGLEQLYGNVGNVLPYAYTNEKFFFSKAGPKFREYEGMTIMITKALYGLCLSSEQLHSHLAN